METRQSAIGNRPYTLHRWGPVLLALLVYGALVAWGMRFRADAINADAICYIRHAKYLIVGNARYFPSAYWSPALSLLMAPMMLFKIDALHAARVTMIGCGALLLVSSFYFFHRRCPASPAGRYAAACALAAIAARGAVAQITPDVLLAACLMAYFAAMTHPVLLRRRRVALAAGILGGLAFLAKSYGLPFVLAHGTFALALLWIRRRAAPVRVGRTLAFWLAGIFCIAGPWIAILSITYGRFTISTVGPIAHAMLGPNPRVREGEHFGAPPDPYLDNNETLDRQHWNYWSPLENGDNFDRQLQIARRHGAAIVLSLSELAPGCLVIVILAVAACMLWRRGRGRWRVAFLLGSILLFASGFLLVWFEARYILNVVWPLAVALSAAVAVSLRWRRRRCWPVLRTWVVGRLLPAGLALAIGYGALAAYREVLEEDNGRVYRTVARRLKEAKIPGPVACHVQRAGRYVAFHLGAKFAGFPAGVSPQEAEQLLYGGDVATVLIFRAPQGNLSRDTRQERRRNDPGAVIVSTGRWQRRARVPLEQGQYVEAWVKVVK